MAERQLPKLNVAGSIPVSRSRNSGISIILVSPQNTYCVSLSLSMAAVRTISTVTASWYSIFHSGEC